MLAALDIDVWTLRREHLTQAGQSGAGSDFADSLSSEASSAVSGGAPPRSGGPSAARALLEESQAAVGSASAAIPAAAMPLSVESKDSQTTLASAPVSAPQPVVNLWCLSGPYGVLLSNFTGLSPHAQRLLSDVFQAAMRIAAGTSSASSVQKAESKSSKKLAAQQLRFNWPPADSGAGLGAGASTSRALRGFLSRQLQDKPGAFILYAAPELADLLSEAQLALAPERLIYTGDPEALLADSAAKRALWQTLNTL